MAGAKVTTTPSTGLPKASVRRTAGGTRTGLPTWADWPSPPGCIVRAAALPAVMVNAALVSGVSVPALVVSV
jgi:hypothetical protein